MIRLAHLLPGLGVGGMEQMALNLCRFRNRKDFDIRVAALADGPMAEEFRQAGVPVFIGDDSLAAAVRWAELLNLHSCGPHAEWDRWAGAEDTPTVITLHAALSMPELPALTICTSKYAYELQPQKNRCVMIPNGIDVEQFSPRPSQEKREEIILTRVCRPSKCALYFWDAMSQALQRYPRARLQIVGNEKPADSTEQIQFLGVRRDIPEILAQSDLFVYAPYPNFGTKDLVVMEALAAGVPCVVTDVNAVGGSVEQGKNGFLTPFGDAEAFAERVGQLIEDTELRQKMGETARRLACQQFDIRKTVRRYEEIYRTVLGFHDLFG